MDRIQFAARTKKIGDEIVIAVPPDVLAKLGIGEGADLVFEARKYGIAVLPKKR